MLIIPDYRPLDKDQKKAVRVAHQLGHKIGLFFDAGKGKTLTAIRIIQPIRRRSFFPALIFCRRDDYLTWKLELKREGVSEDDMFFIEHRDEYHLKKNDKAKNGYEFEQFQEFPDKPKQWNFVTYDLVKGEAPKDEHKRRKKKSKKINLTDAGEWVKKHQYDFEIVGGDEIHTIKNWDSYRTKVVHYLIKPIPRRIGCSATPITQNMIESFSIGLFCDRGKAFGTNYYKYLTKYFINVPQAGWFPKKGAKEEIREKMAEFSVSAKLEVDVEERPTIIKGVPLMGKQKRLYEQVLNDWELELDDGRILEYRYVMSQIHKLKQIASGFYYDPDKNAKRFPYQKIHWLQAAMKSPEIFKDVPKIVIYTNYKDELERVYDLTQKLKLNAIKFDMTATKQKENARLAFAHQPEIQYFIIAEDKATGMDELKVASHAVYHSNSWRVLSKIQSLGRTRRKGSEIHDYLQNYELMTEGTIDVTSYIAATKGMGAAKYIMEMSQLGYPIRKLVA